MSPASEYLPPPNDADAFEMLCLDLWREIWGDPTAQRIGRSGQEQKGVDIVGKQDGRQIGVQCKQKDALDNKKLSLTVVKEEVEKAKAFIPKLSLFIVATTARRDAKLQEGVSQLPDSGFEVKVWSWDDIEEDLQSRPKLLDRIFEVYWPRMGRQHVQKIATTRVIHVAERLFGRARRLEQLDAAWNDPNIHVVTLVAWGGVGKTSLVANWADSLVKRNCDGADYFDWSFYSQGAGDTRHTSADPFIDTALRFWSETATADSAASAWDKGSHLAKILATRRALLVLDGLEPLQHPPGPLAGELKDPAMTALLKGLAQRNAGLCVVTTRGRVADLGRWEDGGVQRWELEQLSTEVGVQLLESLGVKGSIADLSAAVRKVQGHALTLTLLGRFLKRVHEGDVRRCDRVKLDNLRKVQGGEHAFSVIAAYERWLAGGGENAIRQLAVLRLLGLFDRQASANMLKVLRTAPAIQGVTEPLVGLDDEDWKIVLADLEDAALLTEQGGSLDAHPLVRDFFGQHLRKNNVKGWQAAHGRLFDHLKDKTEHRPEGLAALEPLYKAVYHGCQAERHQEALVVYQERILRGIEGDEFYSWRTLGAFGANLSALAGFFETAWTQVSGALSKVAQSYVLSDAGFHLRALGRLSEALEPMRLGLEGAVRQKNWKYSAAYANNLSKLRLTLGEVVAAIEDAKKSVAFADSSGDSYQQLARRTTLADALHQAGFEEAAHELFHEAEAIWATRWPQSPLLSSLSGFRYCDLLLAPAERAASCQDGSKATSLLARCHDVERRVTQTLPIPEREALLFDIGLYHLTLGRAQLYRMILSGNAEKLSAEAYGHVEKAVSCLRSSGRLDFLPLGLLTRAWLRSLGGDREGAQADLFTAQETAELGSMRLYLADVALYRARLFRDLAALNKARLLVEKYDYGRRRPEIANLEALGLGACR